MKYFYPESSGIEWHFSKDFLLNFSRSFHYFNDLCICTLNTLSLVAFGCARWTTLLYVIIFFCHMKIKNILNTKDDWLRITHIHIRPSKFEWLESWWIVMNVFFSFVPLWIMDMPVTSYRMNSSGFLSSWIIPYIPI